MLKKKTKEKWLKALRSKQYTWGRGDYRRERGDDGYCHCAMGVLLEIEGAFKQADFIYGCKNESYLSLWMTDLGLTPLDQSLIVQLNDESWTRSYREAAGYVEEMETEN